MDDETGQPIDPEKSKITPPASPARPPMLSDVEIATRVDVGRPVEAVPMEIDQEGDDEEGDEDDVDADLERLLASPDVENLRAKRQTRSSSSSSCCRCGHEGPGNTTIVFPRIFARTGWGMVGPHWFGPFFVVLIVAWASHYFIRLAWSIGPVTTIVCMMASLWTIYTLCAVSFHDPGIVTAQTPPDDVDMSRWRWCDFCNVYQPPDGQHCPDCNVCVEGYDHHCVWMGTCIGKKNYRQFIRFNLSWLLYLVYAVGWVYVIGPSLYSRKD